MQMHEQTHDTFARFALEEGVIADFHAAEMMIRGLIKRLIREEDFFHHH